MSQILDAITQKFASAVALCAAAEAKIGTERDLRTAQVSSLQNRVHALEVTRDEMATELINKQSAIDQLTARVNALVASLTELGVDAGI